jgi:hypothetical protein
VYVKQAFDTESYSRRTAPTNKDGKNVHPEEQIGIIISQALLERKGSH